MVYKLELTIEAQDFSNLVRLFNDAGTSLEQGNMWSEAAGPAGTMHVAVTGLNEDDFEAGWERWKKG